MIKNACPSHFHIYIDTFSNKRYQSYINNTFLLHTQMPTSTFMTASIEPHGPAAEADSAMGVQEQLLGTHPVNNSGTPHI